MNNHRKRHVLEAYRTICTEQELFILNRNDRFLMHDPSKRNVKAFLKRNAIVSHFENGEAYVYASYEAYLYAKEFEEYDDCS